MRGRGLAGRRPTPEGAAGPHRPAGCAARGAPRALRWGWARAWLREQTRRASDPFSAAARTQRRLTVPPEHLLLLRVASGLVGVLCSLKATVAVDDEVRRWPPGYAPAGDAGS